MGELHELMEQYAAMRTELDPLVKQMNELKTQIQGAVKEQKENVTHAGVKAVYRKGNGWQYSWLKAALDKYAEEHPAILKCRKRSQKKASVAVSFSG